LPHLAELLFFLENAPKLPDFICLQETHTQNDNLPSILSYSSVCFSRSEGKGGGCAIYIKDEINYNVINLNLEVNTEIEAIGIKFKNKSNGKSISLISVYIPPGINISVNKLNSLVSGENIILTGDFNAKNKLWGFPVNDARGKVVKEFIEINNLICINNGMGTRLNYNGTLFI